jgi:hypothetical protein
MKLSILSKKYFVQYSHNQKGVILVMSLVIMAMVFGISITMSRIMLGQLESSVREGSFIGAFYAGDSGIERGLYRYRKNANGGDFAGTLSTGGTYNVQFLSPGAGGCSPTALTLCIASTGAFEGTRRRVRVIF